MSLDDLCKGELCERAFDLLAVGAPSIIALFLIVYAHKTLSTRLKEASEANQDEDSIVYRTQLNRVWVVALLLLVAHAGVFVWLRVGPAAEKEKGFVAGAFLGLSNDRGVDLERIRDRLYVRVSTSGDYRPWIIRDTPQMERETFKITSEGTTLMCPVDLTEIEGEPPQTVELALERDKTQAHRPFRLRLVHPGEELFAWECSLLTDDVPPEQPRNGGPLDVFDAAAPLDEGVGEEGSQGWLGPLFGLGRALAAADLNEVDRTLTALNNDDFRIRREARRVIARDFEPYREWAEYVARDEAAYQAGESRYGRPSYRSRLGLVYALSRRHPLPREGMLEPPDLSEQIMDFALEQGLSEDAHLRASAKRFVISYPGPDMIARLGELWAGVQAAQNDDRRIWARELLTHFYYNRGILVILARRDGIPGMPEAKRALPALKRAERLARELPEAMRAFEIAKIRYGVGWVHVVGVNEGFGDPFNEEAARAAFRDALRLVGGRGKEYPYAWQLPLMERYLNNPDYNLFNK